MTNPQHESPIRVGDVLAEKYRVEKILGAGAMGVVVAARHIELGELWAIKFMLPAALGNAEGVERFVREARAAARLRSRHVAKVHDIGRLPNGAPYLVMEHLTGTDLKGLLEQRGPLPPAEGVRYVLQACEALGEAHAAGIVHRDLKPANLFLTTEVNGAPCLKLLDFGIAKVSGGAPGGMEMTATSALLGTPLYMSPEQMRGARDVDARADIWALGVILYRMFAGKTPFTGSSVTEICSAVIADAPEPLSRIRSDLPPGLEAVVARCLEKNAAQRFQSVAELAAALAPFAQAAAAQPAAFVPPSTQGAYPYSQGPAAPSQQASFAQGGPQGGYSHPHGPASYGMAAAAASATPAPAAKSSKAPLVIGAVLAVLGVAGIAVAAVVLTSSEKDSGAPGGAAANPQRPTVADPRPVSTGTSATPASPVRGGSPVAAGPKAAALAPGGQPASGQPASGQPASSPAASTQPTSAAAAAPGSLAVGAACKAAASCSSGFCVDGVCCDSACTEKCMACTPQKKFSGGGPGYCGFISGGEDPDKECGGSDKRCSGMGSCVTLTPTQIKNLTGHD